MNYKVVYEKRAIKSFQKIDKGQRKMIFSWIDKNLVNTKNPRKYGKPLSGKLKDYWRYRIGNYRIITNIKDDEIKIIIVNIGHRSDIYN